MRQKAIFITGTDTGVGKTVITAGLAVSLRQRGMDVGVMKPIATGAVKRNGRLISCDVEFETVEKVNGLILNEVRDLKLNREYTLRSLANARDESVEKVFQHSQFLKKVSAVDDELSLINPYLSELPLAPSVAFGRKTISIKRIIDCLNELNQRHELVLVEGIGGLLVPIKKDYLVADLIRDLDIPLIIVSSNRLGTINHTLLTIKQAQDYGCNILGVIFNKVTQNKDDISQRTNPEIITKIAKLSVFGEIPYMRNISVEKNKVGKLAEIFKKNINLDLIVRKIKDQNQRNYKNLASIDKKYVWHPFTQMKDWQKEEPVIIKEANGVYLKDTRGRWFLDGVSSLWVNVHGHRRKEIDLAIKRQLNKVAHSTLLGLGNVPSIKLAEKLVKIAPKGLTKVFYSDNGSTSVEVALKMAFQYWQHIGKTKKTQFVYLDNSYHGDTIGSVSVGGIDLFHKVFRPLLFNSFEVDSPYCYRCPLTRIPANPCLTARQATRINANKKYPNCKLACLKKLENILKNHHKEIAALIVEPLVQAAGGMIVWPKGILNTMRKLCDKYNVLLIVDEVAVGFGRTGKMFACEHENVSPDLLCLSKGLSAGYLPLAATLVKEEIYNAFLGDYAQAKTFFHGHSYTGNPLACAAALASLEIFRKDRTIENLQSKIKFLEKELQRFKDLSCVGDVRQKGLIVGIELVKDKTTKEPFAFEEKIGIKVCQEARKYGVILRPLGNIIVLMPPLTITKEQLRHLLDISYEAIRFITEK